MENEEESIQLLNRQINEQLLNEQKSTEETHYEAIQSDSHEKNKDLINLGLLVGLHACGDLSCSTLNLFVSNPAIHGLSLVSCCYHKMTQFPISKAFKESIFEYKDIRSCNNDSMNERLSCLSSPHTLRLASQEPFTRYFQYFMKKFNNSEKHRSFLVHVYLLYFRRKLGHETNKR